jgi:hypothetical protein
MLRDEWYTVLKILLLFALETKLKPYFQRVVYPWNLVPVNMMSDPVSPPPVKSMQSSMPVICVVFATTLPLRSHIVSRKGNVWVTASSRLKIGSYKVFVEKCYRHLKGRFKGVNKIFF